MVEADPGERPDGPPSPLKKALAGWELSKQQGVTQALFDWAETLRRKQNAYNDKDIGVVVVRINQAFTCLKISSHYFAQCPPSAFGVFLQ